MSAGVKSSGISEELKAPRLGSFRYVGNSALGIDIHITGILKDKCAIKVRPVSLPEFGTF